MAELKRWRVTYRDGEVGPYTLVLKGYDREHVRERFYENPDDSDGWEIVSIERISES